MSSVPSRKFAFLLLLLLIPVLVAVLWGRLDGKTLPEGFALGNGRLEAIEVDVATKVAGRLLELGPREGADVTAGQVLGRLDAEDLAAQLRAAEAATRQAREAGRVAREAARAAQVQLQLARTTLVRTENLDRKGFVTGDKLDRDRSAVKTAEVALAGGQAQVAEAVAAEAAAMEKARSLAVTLEDTAFKAPLSGRVLYRLAEPGEVLGAGGKVLTLLDLDNVFMTVFLPAAEATRLPLGSEARIVLDGLSATPIPARVTFVSPQAQFTPKEVETRSEREKLMFRVKLNVDAGWLQSHRDLAKPGMPGVAYVRLDASRPWPAQLPSR
ncbi:HlyD family secretion protein [Denitratisoma sp. DHT3]|uniref:HlyD family secretion protein n=1 Tax=Denitratisoma sp. DHT3 TaxID=1981880 RepID=UPI001C95867D|nr:HlyD family efflux transporter periplasmic adaptor subunit [Denitratisoma sp. DHT3]